jgi:transcription elongation factor GreA
VSDVTETAAASNNFLTRDAYERLTAELRHLSGEGRSDIARRIEAAREEGDLKENGGYHAAKEEQGKMEARIRQLEHLLQNATVGEAPADDGVVEPGMLVEVEMFGETQTFLLGSREILGDNDDLQVYSERSPLGLGILGKTAGEVTSYQAPNGKDIKVKIVSAKPYTG